MDMARLKESSRCTYRAFLRTEKGQPHGKAANPVTSDKAFGENWNVREAASAEP
jgi:hypothetical protein